MKKKLRKIPTSQSLANVALHYLGRYAASEASLRRVLENRLRRAMLEHRDFAENKDQQNALRISIDAIVEGHKKTGVINDVTYAEIKVNSLRRQGKSRRIIQQKLTLKGVKEPAVRVAFEQNDDGQEPEEREFEAATTLARRRRFGPFRRGEASDVRVRKEIATLLRAGFAYGVIKRVMGSVPDELQELDTDI